MTATAKWGLLVAVLAFAWLAQNVSAREIPGDIQGNKHIVVLKEDVDARSFVERLRSGPKDREESVLFEIDHVYEHVISGFSVTTSDQGLEMIRKFDEVDKIEKDGEVSTDCWPPFVPSVPWGLDRIDQTTLPLDHAKVYQGYGAGAHIYIIDTGVSSTHNEFTGRFSTQGYDFMGGSIGMDCNGHGTHVAGTAAGTTYGVAKEATVHSVRVLGCSGTGTWSGVIGGMDWIAANAIKPAVASMSLGGLRHPVVNTAVQNLFNRRIVVSVAAGNSNDDACLYSPASAPNAITVGATDIDDNRASFSNFGLCLDIFAPGKDIESAWIGSNSDTNTISGTSMACPHVSGAAAILLGLNPGLSPAQVAADLISLSSLNQVVGPGTGSQNRLLFIG